MNHYRFFFFFLPQADIGRHIAELMSEVVTEVRTFQQQRSAEGDVAAVSVVSSLDQQLVTLRAECGQGEQPLCFFSACASLARTGIVFFFFSSKSTSLAKIGIAIFIYICLSG